MRRYRLFFCLKTGLAAVLGTILMIMTCCGAGNLPDSSITAGTDTSGPEASGAETVKPETSAEDAAEAEDSAEETAAVTEKTQDTEETAVPAKETKKAELPEETSKTEPETSSVAGVIPIETERLNRFLTGIVQQDVVNTGTDLDEDAELVRFAFGYRRTNDPESVLEQEEDGASCRILTLEQVNETLTALFGKTITPDKEDYSVQIGKSECFHCAFRDGCFRNTAPYPTEQFTFPVRFALTDEIDEEHSTLHFRLYKINPYEWGIGEAERHVSVMPAASFLDAERGAAAEQGWVLKIGEGEAVLRDLGEDLQLIEMTGALYHK